MHRNRASIRIPLLLGAALVLGPIASDSSLRAPFDERRIEELQEAGLVARRAARPEDLGSPPRNALAATAAAAAARGSRSTRVSGARVSIPLGGVH
ncbi:MAG TPA: hypothetical protein VGV61_17060 [Thermoanaerobaculia bacterium]|nr:hypothetical protein [Thermoanaerobaculia bacterium]